MLINRFYNSIPISVGNDSGARTTPLGTGSMNIKELREGAGYSNVHIFTYNELRLATKQFRPDFILGEGGFGVVYKGVIDDSVRAGYKSTEVAIKELNREGFQGDREWLVSYFTFFQFIFWLMHNKLVGLVLRFQYLMFNIPRN